MPTPSTNVGKVYLVGAGPGDPDLITLRGCHCLQQADVVLYDYLVNPSLLAHAPVHAERVCLGRHGRERIMPQDEVNQRMIAAARAGRTVVRLKGGDPAIFAHGFEEIEALVAANIPYEVVPGITAALAAGSYAGIPLTHGELASAVALVTGQQRESKQRGSIEDSALDFAALAAFPGTLVLYMGATTARDWTTALIRAGKDPTTPAAIIRRCSWPDQETINCRLDQVAAEIDERHLRPPVITIVGAVVASAHVPSWFVARPLFGVRVLVTRPAHQAESLARRLSQLGADVLEQPAIEITDPPEWGSVDRAIARMSGFQWLVFSSANGVQYFLNRLCRDGRDLRALAGVRLAAIGSATAEELSAWRLTADVVPDEFRAEALAGALADRVAGARVLLVRASRGREVLAEELCAAGAQVEQVVAYTSRDVPTPDAEITARLASGDIDWITVTSSAIARALVALFGDALHKARLASISPITSRTLRELGFEPAAEATDYTMAGLVDAIARHV